VETPPVGDVPARRGRRCQHPVHPPRGHVSPKPTGRAPCWAGALLHGVPGGRAGGVGRHGPGSCCAARCTVPDPVRCRRPPSCAKTLAAAEQAWAKGGPGRRTGDPHREDPLRRARLALAALARRRTCPRRSSCRSAWSAVGDVAWAHLPVEPLTCYGERIRAASPFRPDQDGRLHGTAIFGYLADETRPPQRPVRGHCPVCSVRRAGEVWWSTGKPWPCCTRPHGGRRWQSGGMTNHPHCPPKPMSRPPAWRIRPYGPAARRCWTSTWMVSAWCFKTGNHLQTHRNHFKLRGRAERTVVANRVRRWWSPRPAANHGPRGGRPLHRLLDLPAVVYVPGNRAGGQGPAASRPPAHG